MAKCIRKKHNQDECATDIRRCLICGEGFDGGCVFGTIKDECATDIRRCLMCGEGCDGGRVFGTIKRQQNFYMPEGFQ